MLWFYKIRGTAISDFRKSFLLKFKPLSNTYDGVLDMDKAIALFEELADIPEIPYGYLRTGCNERSIVMSDLLLQAGYRPDRIWADNRIEGEMMIYQSEDGEMAAWGFHVAVVLNVGTGVDETTPLVFDPAIFDGPVTVDEWRDKIMRSNNLEQLPHNDAPMYIAMSVMDDPDPWGDMVAQAHMTLPDLQSEQERTLGDIKRMVWESSIKKEFCERAGRNRKASGQTWLTKRSFKTSSPPNP